MAYWPKTADVVVLSGTVAMMGAPSAFPSLAPAMGQALFWLGLAGMVIYPCARAAWHFGSKHFDRKGILMIGDNGKPESSREDDLIVGDDSVVMGRVSGPVGNRSVVIGLTHGTNVILNSPMAIGHRAKAGPGSIAIGAGAGAGSDKDES